MGPHKASKLYLEKHPHAKKFRVTLYGSLAATGKGHMTDIAINEIPQVNFNDEKLQKRLIAEAKFLRGFYYFDLVKNFGGLPMVLDLKMPNEVQGITRSTKEETYAQIEQDLKDAIADLPKQSEYSDADKGRATSGAAARWRARAAPTRAAWARWKRWWTPCLLDRCAKRKVSRKISRWRLLELREQLSKM